MTESMPTPRELAEMIVNAQYDSKEPNMDILVDELLAYVKDGYPRKTARLQIESVIENRKVKKKKKNKPKKSRQPLLAEAYTYAIHLIQQKGTEDLVNTQLKLFYWFDHKGLTLDESYEIIHQAKKDFEQSVKEESEIEPTQEVIFDKEPEISTSIETQVESQDEIESRLYSFASNFLFNYQDPGKKILRSELINAVNDYIEHFSLEYNDVQKLADEAIAEFREKSKTISEFKTAHQELYKTKEKKVSTPIQSHVSKVETIKDETLPQDTIPKKAKIDEKHVFILRNLRHVEYPALLVDSFIQKTKKSRATFFRKVNQLERWGLIVHVNQGTPRRYKLHPRLLNSSLKFLVVGEGTSLTFESTSQMAPIDEKSPLDPSSKSQLVSSSVSISAAAETEPCTSETEPKSTSKTTPISEQGDLVPHSKSQSQSHVDKISSDPKDLGGTSETASHTTRKTVPISENQPQQPDHIVTQEPLLVSNASKSQKKAGTSETESKSTSQNASFSEKKEEGKDPIEDPRTSSVSTSPDREKLREKSETESETTSKIPSFEEMVAKFDPRNIRSHDYLYICEIKRAPKDFRQQLAGCNWLESKEGMNNWKWYRGGLKLHNIQCHFHIYTRKVTIQLLEVSSPDPFANNAIADDIAVQVTAYLEDQYPGLVLYDLKRRSRLEVKKLHHAIPNHPIAIRAFELSYTSTGTRFGVDDSKGNKEIEAHNHKYSTEDIDNYVEDCDFKAENDYWFRDSARDIQQNGRNLQKTTEIQKEAAEIQKEAAKQIEEVSKTQLWQISGQRSQTEVFQSFINGSMHLIEKNLTLEERVKALEQHLPTISKPNAFIREREMFDPAFTLVKRLEHIVRKNPGISRVDLIQQFGWKVGSVGPTIGRLTKRINLREENRRLFISA